MKPLISVLMSTCNDAPFLRMAIDSILGQTFTDFEFIIINDASTDDTPAILDSFHDPRIIRLDNSTNLKLPASLNLGLAIAQGKYIARMDSDDVSNQERLEKQFQFMEEHPDIGVLSTAYRVVNQNMEYVTTWTLPQTHNELMLRMLFSSPALHGSALIRKDKLKKVHGYNAAYARKQDIELWTRMCKVTRFLSLPDALYQYRVRSDYKEKGAERWKISDEIRRHFLAELIDGTVTENDYMNFRLGQTADPTRILTIDETFAAINLLFTAFNSLKTKGYFYGDLSMVTPDVSTCMVRILGHCSELKQFLPELFRFSSSGSISKYYWFNNDFPKVRRWLGYGISSPREFFSELVHHKRKKDG
jgi:glycosyltransferase involved in cell wall biosynthesis